MCQKQDEAFGRAEACLVVTMTRLQRGQSVQKKPRMRSEARLHEYTWARRVLLIRAAPCQASVTGEGAPGEGAWGGAGLALELRPEGAGGAERASPAWGVPGGVNAPKPPTGWATAPLLRLLLVLASVGVRLAEGWGLVLLGPPAAEVGVPLSCDGGRGGAKSKSSSSWGARCTARMRASRLKRSARTLPGGMPHTWGTCWGGMEPCPAPLLFSAALTGCPLAVA